MKIGEEKITEWFLRIALSVTLLSAVADRFGLWSEKLSVWGNWNNFIAYTQQLNRGLPSSLINFVGGFATFLEILFAIMLVTTFKTSLFAKATGYLLLIFGIAMAVSLNVKAPLDYSVFVGSSAAFALAALTKKP